MVLLGKFSRTPRTPRTPCTPCEVETIKNCASGLQVSCVIIYAMPIK